VCCSVLQCVAVCCSVLQCVAVCCGWFWFVFGMFQVLICVFQCVAVCCSVLQCEAVCCSVLRLGFVSVWDVSGAGMCVAV